MIIEITLGPGETIGELQPIKDAVRALGHRVDFIEVETCSRAKDYNWKLELRSPRRRRGMAEHSARQQDWRHVMFKMFAAALLLALGGALAAPHLAHADQFGPNCQTDTVRRGILGLDFQTRTVCDTPTRPDGSWERTRTFWYPAHQVPMRTTCTGGTYSSTCSTYPGYWADVSIIEQLKYVVFPYNVLPDEPGHLPV